MTVGGTLAVFGGASQIGRALAETAPPPGWRLLLLSRAAADITDAGAVAAALVGSAARVVLNAAAFTAVDRAETEREAAFAVNCDGAALVAAAAAARGLPVIHISSDYVFAGTKRQPYVEADAAVPVSVYGASKLAGERAVLDANERAAVLRTAWLFGAHNANFARSILRLASQRDEIGVVDDQIGCPTAAGDLAAAVWALAPRLATAEDADLFGVFHCCGDDVVSRHQFAAAVLAEAAALGVDVARLKAIPTSAYPLPAARPAYSALSCARLRTVHGIGPLPWRRSLAACVARLLGEP